MNTIYLSLEELQWVQFVMKSLTLEQKVGQVFCPTMMEETLTAEEQIDAYATRLRDEMIRFVPGGYYLNRYYIPTTPALLNQLLEIAPVPPLICADMEAGAGSGLGGVIAPGLVTFPPAMGIGATDSEQYAYQVGRCTAWQARAIGVHFVLAPVLDVNINPENPIINIRSFGEDPERVSRLGSALIRGLQDGGVAASAKHFPGQGDASDDSHLLLSTITADRERLNRVELYPFRRAIEEADVYAIMTGHLAVPALESTAGLPATLSSRILHDLLRGELGYKGLIVSDALLMGGITSLFEAGEAAVRAFKAGVDWLLMPPDFHRAYQAVLDAVRSGEISEKRLDESVYRVLSIKAKAGLHQNERVDLENLEDLETLNHFSSRMSDTVCASAVTLIRNEDKTLPLSGMDKMAVFMLTDSDDDFYDDGYAFFQEINSRSMNVEEFLSLNSDTNSSRMETAHRLIKKSDVVLFGLIIRVLPEKGTVELPPEFCQLIDSAIHDGKTVVIISFGHPYVLRRFPNVHAFLCAYQYFHPMIASVVEVLFGERVPIGKLPVRIPTICERGTGLSF